MVIMITGLLEFLDRHLWMSRRQREHCLTTTPLKMTRFDLKRKKSYNCNWEKRNYFVKNILEENAQQIPDD